MKSRKPLPFTLTPKLFVILPASLAAGAWAPWGWQALVYLWQPRVFHLSSGLFKNLTAIPWDCKGLWAWSSLYLSFMLAFHRGFVALSSDEELIGLDFINTGLQVFSGWWLSSAILQTVSRKNTLTYNIYIRYVWQLVNISAMVKISWTRSTRDSIF